MIEALTNGARLQATITLVSAFFVAGTIWHRVSANAAAMRETMEEILANQSEMKHQLETLLNK